MNLFNEFLGPCLGMTMPNNASLQDIYTQEEGKSIAIDFDSFLVTPLQLQLFASLALGARIAGYRTVSCMNIYLILD